MTARFQVFGWNLNVARGGAGDLITSVDTLADAKTISPGTDFAHVYDTETERIVAVFSHMSYGPLDHAGQYPDQIPVWKDE